MSKKIEDYLHLYIGCQILDLYSERIGKLHGVNMGTVEPVQVLHKSLWGLQFTEVKPILRRLSSMTEEEAIELYDFLYPSSTAERKIKRFAITNHLDDKGVYWEGKIAIFDYIDWFPWLLKRGFDLFGLIDAGLAIDAATIKTND